MTVTRRELAAMLRAARTVAAVREPVHTQRFACAALAAACVATAVFSEQIVGFPHGTGVRAFLFARAGSVLPAPQQDQWSQEESQMRSLQSMAVVAASSFAVASGAMAQTAVQWRVEDGGNGHWYAERASLRSQPDAAAAATMEGGHLVSIGSAAENSFLVNQHFPYGPFSAPVAHWTSGVRTPSGAWAWATGEPWSYSNFDAGEPNGCCGADVRFVLIRTYPGHEGAWDDTSTNGNGDQAPQPSIVEWSADCNNDGIVDYGQILAGDLLDTNHNNIPDCCENGGSCNPCSADVDQSGAINGVDLAAVLNNWGTSGGKQPRSDINHDGIVNGSDLAEVLNAWGPCH